MKKVIAKKKYGQNFLKDSSIIYKIIQSMPRNTNHLVEIGPGLGDLTEKLVEYKDLTAYEVDIDLISILRSKFIEQLNKGNFTLVHGDVIDIWDKKQNLYDGKYDLIANLPYYIATNIILRALEDINCEYIIVMIQKEVAQKFTAEVNQKEYSFLSIITELLAVDSKVLFDVPPSAFEPPPKIISSILYIRKDINKSIEKGFKDFLKICFLQPRKKLSKNLLTILSKNEISLLYETFDIKETIRPHEVSSSLYSQMYTKVKNGKNRD